ncbi:MAG TPA: nuclear transport factor 2 family protein [Candidatus Binataceae bacterium]|nr:nuclear transport factor 2 family protein [Candidatus Binataceae bacterium]
MKKVTIALGLAIVTFTATLAAASIARADDKADIEALEKRVAAGVEAKNADAIMANYIPGDSLIVFDLIPPRQYVGWDAYKKDWAGVIGGCADSPKMEISDLDITADGKLAFSHSIQHFVCTDAKGNKMEMTMRATDAYRKIKGKWLIVHEHLSAPIDLATGKADLTSKP